MFSPMIATLETVLPRPTILDDFHIDDNFNGTGPRLGCVACGCEARTVVSHDGAVYRRGGLDSAFRTLECSDCNATLIHFGG